MAVYLLRKERNFNANQVARVFGRTRQWASWFTSTLDRKFAASRGAADLVEAARERLKAVGSRRLRRSDTRRLGEPLARRPSCRD